MNSLMKNSNSIIRSANLIKNSFLRLPKYSFFSVNRRNLISFAESEKSFYSDRNLKKNSSLLKFNQNNFSDKKDNESEKKSDEGNKEGKKEDNKPKASNEEPKNNPDDNKDKDNKGNFKVK